MFHHRLAFRVILVVGVWSGNTACTTAAGDVWICNGGDGTLAADYVARSPDRYDLPGPGRSHHGGVAVGYGTHAQWRYLAR